MNLISKTDDFAFPQLTVNSVEKPAEIAAYLESRGVQYGLGAKDPDLDSLVDFGKIDCSGFRDVVLYHMTDGDVNFGVGALSSQYVEPWEKNGFKESSPAEATNTNGALYLFMLPVSATSDGIGHTGFVRNSQTAESHGGHGPGSRPWGPGTETWGWGQHCKLWVLNLGDPS